MTEKLIHYPIPEEARRELIMAGQRALGMRQIGRANTHEYARAIAEIARIAERLRAAHGQTEAEK